MPQGAKRAVSQESEDDRYRRAFAERVYIAFEDYNRGLPRDGKITQGDLGRLVAEQLGVKRPFPQATASRWMSQSNPAVPDNPVIAAIATVLGVDRDWLTYGGREG